MAQPLQYGSKGFITNNDDDIFDYDEDKFNADVQRVGKKRIKNARAEYENYIDGEQPYGETSKKKSIKKKIFDMLESLSRLTRIACDLYNAKMPAEHDEGASMVLYNMSKGIDINKFHIIYMLEQGADPNYMGNNCDTPLHWLARRGSYTAMKILLKAGANPHAYNNRMRNALMEACDTKRTGIQVRMVRLLLTQQNMVHKIDKADSGGNTALMNAIFNNNVWIVRELLISGARASSPNFKGETACDVALWIYSTGLQMSVKELPESTVHPDHILYKLFSPKGRYELWPILAWQETWKYSAELILRMLQRKKMFEDRDSKLKPREAPTQNHAVKNVDLSQKQKKLDLLERDRVQRDKKIRKIVDKSHIREMNELKNWNDKRSQLGQRIDEEFSSSLRSKDPNAGKEWVRDPENTQPNNNSNNSNNNNDRNSINSREDFNDKALNNRNWKQVKVPGKTVYTLPPGDTPTKVKPIKMEDLVRQQFINTHPDGVKYKKSLAVESADDQYARKHGLVKVTVHDEDDEDVDDEGEESKADHDKAVVPNNSDMRHISSVSTLQHSHSASHVQDIQQQQQQQQQQHHHEHNTVKAVATGAHTTTTTSTATLHSRDDNEPKTHTDKTNNLVPSKLALSRSKASDLHHHQALHPDSSKPSKTKWTVATRSSLGFVDPQSTWAQSKLLSPAINPDVFLSDDDDDEVN